MTAVLEVEELAAWLQSGKAFILLDVRERHELKLAALPGALHIAMREIPNRFSELPNDRPTVVMCHHGGRSQRVAEFLEHQGVNAVYNLEGGIDAWSRRIDNSVPSY